MHQARAQRASDTPFPFNRLSENPLRPHDGCPDRPPNIVRTATLSSNLKTPENRVHFS